MIIIDSHFCINEVRILMFLEDGKESILKEIIGYILSLETFKRVSTSEEFQDTTTSLTDE